MKRRVLAQVLLIGLVGAPAFAADPLPTLKETPSSATMPPKRTETPSTASRLPSDVCI